MLLGLMILAVLATAATADMPGASTGEATEVTDTSAVLGGIVNPNKEETTAYFEYGTTTAYGAQTPSQAVGGGNAGKEVSASVTGLAPGTTYHFRLVSTNASGTDYGVDKTFTTLGAGGTPPPPAPPPPAANAATIGAAPTVVVFGRTTTLSGQVTGQNAAGAQVMVEHTATPFTAPFTPVGSPATADAAGNYSVTVAPTVNTRYQVTAKTSPPVTSTPVEVGVAPLIAFNVGDSRIRRSRRVRFRGHVRPAHNGAVARIQRRRKSGRYRTVARVRLRKSAKPDRSIYGRRLRVRRTSTYRILLPADADHVKGRSRARRIRVG